MLKECALAHLCMTDGEQSMQIATLHPFWTLIKPPNRLIKMSVVEILISLADIIDADIIMCPYPKNKDI